MGLGWSIVRSLQIIQRQLKGVRPACLPPPPAAWRQDPASLSLVVRSNLHDTFGSDGSRDEVPFRWECGWAWPGLPAGVGVGSGQAGADKVSVGVLGSGAVRGG